MSSICEYKNVYTKFYYWFFYLLIKKKQIFPHFAFLKWLIPFRTSETSDLTLALGWPWSDLTGGVERKTERHMGIIMWAAHGEIPDQTSSGYVFHTESLYYPLLPINLFTCPKRSFQHSYICRCRNVDVGSLSQTFIAPITVFWKNAAGVKFRLW